MYLREFKIGDAHNMLEWMHDDSIVHDLCKNFMEFSIEDCENFIGKATFQENDYHMAIVGDNDEYMGTVSLKNIDMTVGIAEFGIVVRKCAMGKGYSSFAMKEMLHKGFMELGLKRIFWCVSPNNDRALRFYDKNGYVRCNISNVCIDISKCGYNENDIKCFIWYIIENEGCKV